MAFDYGLVGDRHRPPTLRTRGICRISQGSTVTTILKQMHLGRLLKSYFSLPSPVHCAKSYSVSAAATLVSLLPMLRAKGAAAVALERERSKQVHFRIYAPRLARARFMFYGGRAGSKNESGNMVPQLRKRASGWPKLGFVRVLLSI